MRRAGIAEALKAGHSAAAAETDEGKLRVLGIGSDVSREFQRGGVNAFARLAMDFVETGPIQPQVGDDGRTEGVHQIEGCSKVFAREVRAGRDVVEQPVLVLETIVVANVEEQLVVLANVVV